MSVTFEKESDYCYSIKGPIWLVLYMDKYIYRDTNAWSCFVLKHGTITDTNIDSLIDKIRKIILEIVLSIRQDMIDIYEQEDFKRINK